MTTAMMARPKSALVFAFSISALLLSVVLWWRSMHHIDYPELEFGHRCDISAFSTGSKVRFSFAMAILRGKTVSWEVQAGPVTGSGYNRWFPRPFDYDSNLHDHIGYHLIIGVTVAYWVIALIWLIPAIPALWQLCRRPRLAGVCKRCGYDLRATPVRCPECGWVADPHAQVD